MGFLQAELVYSGYFLPTIVTQSSHKPDLTAGPISWIYGSFALLTVQSSQSISVNVVLNFLWVGYVWRLFCLKSPALESPEFVFKILCTFKEKSVAV